MQHQRVEHEKKSAVAMDISKVERERNVRELATRLLFTLEKHGAMFTLARDVDVPEPVRHENLTLEEVEDVLNTWKLRGPHGG
jgi:hypothetical protein